MQPTLCSKCKKNVAVVFISKLENGKTVNEGLCLKCAKEIGLPQVNDLMNRMGITDEDLDTITSEMMQAFGGAENLEGLMEASSDDSDDEEDEEGKTATFLPKPIYQEAGSGMHVHMLLFKNGLPLFYDEEGYSGLSRTAHYFMGGLLKHIASLCAFTNPSTNSFKRLVPGFEAPVTVGYATSNRSAVIRIPAYAKSPEAKRFELRNPDATANPYYAYAAILMAGLDGIENKIDPAANGWGPYDFNLYTLSPEEQKKIKGLPKSLDEALDALEADHEYLTKGGVFPQRLIDIWVARKRAELRQMEQIPHPAEFNMYYDL